MKKILLALISFTQLTCFGQVQFQKSFSFGEETFGQNIIQTIDHGWISSGYTEYNSDKDCFFLKTNEFGDSLWSISFGDTIDNRGLGMFEKSDGTVMVAGNNYTGGVGQIFLAHLDAGGDSLWLSTYHEDSVMLRFPDICPADNGSIMVCTGTFSLVDLLNRIEVFKVDSNGNVLWSKSYGVAIAASGLWFKIIPTQDGNFVIASAVMEGAQNDASLIKIDSSGSVLWAKSYYFIKNENFGSVAQTQDGGYILGGFRIIDTVNFDPGVFLLKTDSIGDVIWSKTYMGFVPADCPFVKEIRDSGYVFISSFNDPFINSGASLVRTDLTGDTVSTTSFQGWDGIAFQSAVANFDGTFSVQSTKTDSGIAKGYLIKTDHSLNTGCTEYSVDITIANDSISESTYFPVVTSTVVTILPHQYHFRRGCTINNICLTNTIDEADQMDFEIFPNPTNDFLILKSIISSSEVIIYDSLGKKMLSKIIQSDEKIDISILHEGIYFLIINNDKGSIAAKKFIKM